MKEIMTRLLVILCLIGFSVTAWGQGAREPLPSGPIRVDTTWKGIEMLVFKIERIPGDRLLVTICLAANGKAPPFTLIGILPTLLPLNASEADKRVVRTPAPFSLVGATMVDERTQQKYNTLAPDPKGPVYTSSYITESLAPGQCLYLAVQFSIPPPPPPDRNGRIPKQMVSIFLPKATGPLTHIVVPPPTASAPTASP